MIITTNNVQEVSIGIAALSLVAIFIKSFFKKEEKSDENNSNQNMLLIEAMTTQLKGLVETVSNSRSNDIMQLAEKQNKMIETLQELVRTMAVKNEREGNLERVLEKISTELSIQGKIMVLLEERSRGGEIDRKD